MCKMFARAVLAVLLLLLSGRAFQAQVSSPAPSPPIESTEERHGMTRSILEEIDEHSRLMADLEYLCDMIGPRLTGSPKLTQASRWACDKFREYGLENVSLEGWKIPHAWTRVTATGRVVTPTDQRLLLMSAGWAPSTQGPIRGPVIYPEGRTPADLAAYRGRLKGAWILPEPVSVHLPPERLARQPARDEDDPEDDLEDDPDYQAFRRGFEALMIEEGVAGILHDSEKEHGLFRMGCAGDGFKPSRFPEVYLTTESYGLIWRLRNRGPVEVEINVRNEFSDGEVEVYNTVAELVGAERPEEVVILGAHLDSWDLGTGATDNGTGCMAVLEAARALKAVGVRPRRTIRFVLFSGEEQGRFGSKAYVAAHRAEMDRVSAVLIMDMGTGRVRTIALQGRYDLREVMDRAVAPFQDELELEELSLRRTNGTDHLSFHPWGVPAFAVRQHLADYFKTHHTESDTFDKVYGDDMNQAAKVLAAWAYNVAMLPERLPRAPGSRGGFAATANERPDSAPRSPTPPSDPRPGH